MKVYYNQSAAAMLLIYTQKVTPRITYSFRHICTNILNIPVKFTSEIETFVAHDGMKLSYGKQALGNELFIQSVELLTEQGLSDVDYKIQDWEGMPCFFPLSEGSSLPYDIFAAAFYFLSRYEEYMPHVKDSEGRFPATESLAYQEGFLEIPVIDVWAYKFKAVLQRHYPNIVLQGREFRSGTIISVSEAFCYKKKGIMRVVLGFLSDLFHLRVKYVIDRIRVMLNLKPDPFDNYSRIIKFLKKHRIPLKFMFQVSDFSTYDRNINPNRLEFQSLIKSMADYAEVGLQPGYYGTQKVEVLKKEKKRLEFILKRPVESALNHKYNLMLPEGYKNMVELEFKRDYSMGYPQVYGFRAGTCTPFLFYDLNLEVTTPLRIIPYALNNNAARYLKETEVEGKVWQIMQQVKAVEGNLIAIFSNEDFSVYANAKRNYRILKTINEIN